jgi:hypothetical protein
MTGRSHIACDRWQMYADCRHDRQSWISRSSYLADVRHSPCEQAILAWIKINVSKTLDNADSPRHAHCRSPRLESLARSTAVAVPLIPIGHE